MFALPSANALTVGEGVKAKMEELKKSFPKGVDYRIAYDTTPFIEHSVHDVFITIYIAAALVIVVVMVFLQDWRAMLLPIIDIVVALIGTFVVMAGLGFSLNNLSLFGLVLAVGIVVDDSIVVVENIERWMGKGLHAREATIKAMDEITGPVIGITLVLMAVFIPTAFIPGLTGPVLPPVCAHDRGGGVFLGDQRADDGPGPRRGLDQAARRRRKTRRKPCRGWASPCCSASRTYFLLNPIVGGLLVGLFEERSTFLTERAPAKMPRRPSPPSCSASPASSSAGSSPAM